jgi:hypothetical protein
LMRFITASEPQTVHLMGPPQPILSIIRSREAGPESYMGYLIYFSALRLIAGYVTIGAAARSKGLVRSASEKR